MPKNFLAKYLVLPLLLLSFSLVNAPSFSLAQTQKREGALKLFEQTGQEVFGETAPQEIEPYAATIIRAVLTLVGTIFLLVTVYGGLVWMTARGDETKARKARDTVVMATIGLVVVVGAYALTAFIFSRLK